MPKFEDSDYVIGPRRDDSDAQHADNSRDQAQCVEDSWDRENTETDLGLQHERNGAQPADLESVIPPLRLQLCLGGYDAHIAIVGSLLSNLAEDCVVNACCSATNHFTLVGSLDGDEVLYVFVFLRHLCSLAVE